MRHYPLRYQLIHHLLLPPEAHWTQTNHLSLLALLLQKAEIIVYRYLGLLTISGWTGFIDMDASVAQFFIVLGQIS